MILDIAPSIQMWLVLAVTLVVLASFIAERVPLEVTALVGLGVLLVWFQIAPLTDPVTGENRLDASVLLRGFANPALLALLALLAMGQAMVQTGAISGFTRIFEQLSKRRGALAVGLCFVGVLATSAILNNTPVVVMFIPIMQTLAGRLGWSPSKVMMPLSFAAILGGMTTLIGSSTNMLVSSALIDIGQPALKMFDMTLLGLAMAGVGIVYVALIMPRILPPRGGLARTLTGAGPRFVAEIDVSAHSPLVGSTATGGQVHGLPDIAVRLILRGGHSILPPFDGQAIEAGDVLIVAATRPALTDALARHAGYLLTSDTGTESDPAPIGSARRPENRALAEVMIAPASRLIDQPAITEAFQRRFGCLILGIQRRGRVRRQRLGDFRLEAGDVLLVAGSRAHVDALANNPDLVLLAWATRELPMVHRAPYACAIFATVVGVAALGLLPIAVAAIAGAVAMLLTGCLNLRQAARSIDRTIFIVVGSALGLGAAIEATGAADFAAMAAIDQIGNPSPLVAMSVLFLIVAIATNLLTNSVCAVLFTPIGINVAAMLGIDPLIAAVTVVMAANCSFATPIGYQTNLLVMGPGHYRFSDYLRGGLPLLGLMWLTYILVAPLIFDL